MDVCAAKDFQVTLTFLNLKQKDTVAQLISFLLKLRPELSKEGSLFTRREWSIDLLFPSLVLKERFALQLLKSRYLNKRFVEFALRGLEKKEDAEQMLADLRELRSAVAELDGIERKTESAFKKQSEAAASLRFEDLIFDEEQMETTRKNWRQGALRGGRGAVDKQNPLFLKEKLILCKERIKEKEKEVAALESEVRELDAQKKDLEYLYGDQYLEEVFGEKEIEELRRGNEGLEAQIAQLEDELKGFIGSHEELGFELEIDDQSRLSLKRWADQAGREPRRLGRG